MTAAARCTGTVQVSVVRWQAAKGSTHLQTGIKVMAAVCLGSSISCAHRGQTSRLPSPTRCERMRLYLETSFGEFKTMAGEVIVHKDCYSTLVFYIFFRGITNNTNRA